MSHRLPLSREGEAPNLSEKRVCQRCLSVFTDFPLQIRLIDAKLAGDLPSANRETGKLHPPHQHHVKLRLCGEGGAASNSDRRRWSRSLCRGHAPQSRRLPSLCLGLIEPDVLNLMPRSLPSLNAANFLVQTSFCARTVVQAVAAISAQRSGGEITMLFVGIGSAIAIITTLWWHSEVTGRIGSRINFQATFSCLAKLGSGDCQVLWYAGLHQENQIAGLIFWAGILLVIFNIWKKAFIGTDKPSQEHSTRREPKI